jgi:hypothetical protein
MTCKMCKYEFCWICLGKDLRATVLLV